MWRNEKFSGENRLGQDDNHRSSKKYLNYEVKQTGYDIRYVDLNYFIHFVEISLYL